MDESPLCPTSLFFQYIIPILRNCSVDSALLLETPNASNLADCLGRPPPRSQVKNNTDGSPVSRFTLQFQAGLIRCS